MMSMPEKNLTNPTKYSAVLLENNYGTIESDTVFKQFLELEDANHQSIIDDSIMYYSTISLADNIAEEDHIQSTCSDTRVFVNKMIDDEVFNYRVALISQLKELLKFRNENKNKDEFERSQCTIFIIDASTPQLPYPSYCERDYTPQLSFSKDDNGQQKIVVLSDNGCHIFSKTSDNIEFEKIQIKDLIFALARYHLYRHNVISELPWASFDKFIDAYSFIFKKNLQERFHQCACCGESVRSERDDEIVLAFRTELDED